MRSLRYLLHIPADYEADATRKWPLVLFLHGSGERGDDLVAAATHGIPKLAEEQDLPFLAVSPQCPSKGSWSRHLADLAELLDAIADEYRVDPDRVYVTGLSMGGYGTWALACAYPDRFAAAIPICGGGDLRRVRRMKGIPTWVFHGAKDGAVPLSDSEEMVRALDEAGGDVRFTIYPESGHDSWTETYANPQLYEWMLGQSRPPRAE